MLNPKSATKIASPTIISRRLSGEVLISLSKLKPVNTEYQIGKTTSADSWKKVAPRMTVRRAEPARYAALSRIPRTTNGMMLKTSKAREVT
jgi:hypothetical protein